jgi:hypothetical protein
LKNKERKKSMCLIVDKERAERHSELRKSKKMYFVKHFRLGFKTLITPYRSFVVRFGFSGDIVVKGNLEIKEKLNAGMKTGIFGGVAHAYRYGTKELKNDQEVYDMSENVFFRIEVDSDDVVAYGKGGDVCFFKYRIPMSSWKKVKSRCK